MVLASAGTFLSFAKLCYFTFFAKNETMRAREAPSNMQLAMIITALTCILIGVYPGVLFRVLPVYPVHYHPYTPSHVVGVVQLFLLAGLVFMVAKAALSPHEGIVLDFDYFYRIACRGILWLCTAPLNSFRLGAQAFFSREVSAVTRLSRNPISIPGIAAKYLHLTVLQMLGHATGSSGERVRELEEMESRLDEMKNMVYDEDAYKGPIGLGILLA